MKMYYFVYLQMISKMQIYEPYHYQSHQQGGKGLE